MRLQWLGTAGFRIETGKRTILIDPFLTRNKQSKPKVKLKASSIKKADCIFVTHGHFDHYRDVYQIARNTGAKVYCSEQVAKRLRKAGLKKTQVKAVRGNCKESYDDFKVMPLFSNHVRFDPKLVATSFVRIVPHTLDNIDLTKYGKGQVFSYRFDIGGITIHHFGSGGSPPEEMEMLSDMPSPDILLIPLQGHTYINDIGLNYVEAMRPKIVIPHHYDDFYPPISQMLDIMPFVEGVMKKHKKTEVVLLKPLEWWRPKS